MITTTVEPRAASFQFCENAGRRGTNFLHAGFMAEALRLNMSFLKIPEPGFTEDEVTAAFARGEQLLWFPARDADGAPITMQRLHASFENKAPMGGKLLCGINWYESEPFFTIETARADKSGLGSWRFVGISAVPGTKGKNYLEQTVITAAYMRETIYGGNPPEALLPILAEPKEREEELAALVSKDWRKGAETLATLPFNQLFRETPVEALLRVVVNQQVNKTRVLVGEYSWTPSCSRDGRLVGFGCAGDDGADLYGWNPRSASDDLGFFLSRSEVAKRES